MPGGGFDSHRVHVNIYLLGVGYPLMMVVTARILFVLQRPHEFGYENGYTPRQQREDAVGSAVIGGMLWPVLVVMLVAFLPFAAVGWLISRPTRKERNQ